MLKHTEEGFPLPVCASVETWCGVEGEERAHNSRGVEERLEEEEEEDQWKTKQKGDKNNHKHESTD